MSFIKDLAYPSYIVSFFPFFVSHSVSVLVSDHHIYSMIYIYYYSLQKRWIPKWLIFSMISFFFFVPFFHSTKFLFLFSTRFFFCYDFLVVYIKQKELRKIIQLFEGYKSNSLWYFSNIPDIYFRIFIHLNHLFINKKKKICQKKFKWKIILKNLYIFFFQGFFFYFFASFKKSDWKKDQIKNLFRWKWF